MGQIFSQYCICIFIPVSTNINGVRFEIYLLVPTYCSHQLLPYRGQVERRVCETNPNICCNSCFVRGVYVHCVGVCWTLLAVWGPCFSSSLCDPPLPPPPPPLIDHVAHYKSKAAMALLQVANEGSFLTSLNGPDKESNEEINNLVIVALLILIHPACWAGIQWKAGYFLLCHFCVSACFFVFFVD